MTELDSAIEIFVTLFDMGNASAFGLVVSASVLVVQNDSSYRGFSPNDEQMGDTAVVVDSASGNI